MLEGPRLQLPGQIDGQEPRLRIHILVAGHRQRSPYLQRALILLAFDERRKIALWDIFYSLVRPLARFRFQQSARNRPQTHSLAQDDRVILQDVSTFQSGEEMRYSSETPTHINAICASCGARVRLPRNQCQATSLGYSLQPHARCFCGTVASTIVRDPAPAHAVRCGKCGSDQISADRKGFGLWKAVAGGLLTGGIGLLAGFLGSRKVILTCIRCGAQWSAGR